jgi:hypothetical protein
MTPPRLPSNEPPGVRRAARVAFSTMAAELLDHYPDARWIRARAEGDAVLITAVTDEAGNDIPEAVHAFTSMFGSAAALIRAEHILGDETEARLDLQDVAAWNRLPGA